MTLSLAIALSLVASLCIYLASPNQSWLGKSLPMPVGMGLGCAALLAAGWLWMQTFSTVAGIFTLLVLVMLLLTLLPYLSLLKTQQGITDDQA